MKVIQDILEQEFISQITSLAKKRKVRIYLVGGFLRDAIVNRKAKNIDLDFAVEKDAIALAREFAKKTKSTMLKLWTAWSVIEGTSEPVFSYR